MIKFVHILIFVFATNCIMAFNGQNKSDSLILLLQEMPEDSNRVKLLNELTQNNMVNHDRLNLTYIIQALSLSRKLSYSSGEVIALERMAHFYYHENNLDSSLYFFKLAEKLAKETNNITQLTIIHANSSMVYLNLAEYYKGIEIGYHALELAMQINQDIAKGIAFARLANIYLKINNYKKSIEFAEQALYYHTRQNNYYEIYADHYILGKTYCKLFNKEKALFHYQTIVEKQAENENDKPSGNTIYLHGQIFALQGNYKGAMDKFIQAIELMQDANNSKNISEVFLNIIELFVEMLQNNQPTDFAEKSLIKMGYENFDDFARSSYKKMELYKENDILVSTSQALMEYYKIKQRMEEAFDYGQKYISLKDKLYKMDNAKIIAEQLVYFEHNQNEKQIEILNIQNKANEEKIRARQQQIYIFLGSAILLIIVILTIRNRIITIRKVRDLLKTKNEILERERIKSNLSEKFKEEFLANVSHEIRTPMNAIMGITNILLKNKYTEVQKPYLEAMNQSARNLLVLVNDILDLSKLEAGKMHVSNKPFSPRKIINGIYDNLITKAEEKGIALKIIINEDIPETLIGDSKMLHQILINLIRNGISFTDKGRVKLICSMAEINEFRGIVRFIVMDTGAGIILEKQDKILNTFVKVFDKYSTHYDGSGLELAIIKQMVELQGGKIRLKSAPSIGTTFFLEIPYKLPHQKYTRKIESETESSFDLSEISILLVEDNEFNVMVAREELESTIESVKIDIAENGSVAVDLVKENNYDIILMDVQMPEMNGYEATRLIRNFDDSKSNIPIIAMTANNTQQEIENCYNAGMDEYISKPFDTPELLEKIRQQVLGKVTV